MNSIRSVGAASVTICLSLAGFAPGIGAAAISDDQVAVDRQAVAVFAMPSVQAEKSRLRALYVEDPEASQQDGRARLEAGLGSVAFASVLAAANNDPDRPKISWATAATHDWRALHVPGSGHGIDNPDNFYRNIPIDGAARYTITGRIRQDGPLQESFTLYKTRPGSGGTEKQAVFEGSPVLGALTARDLSVASDGSFTITIDHDGANGPGNHIQSGDNPDEILIVRDTLSDWSKERPNGLAVARADGPPLKPQPTNKVIAEQAIQLMRSMVPFWLKFDNDYIYAHPANVIETPRRRDGGWGFAVMARFDLKPDEALVVTLDPAGARYLGFQIADPWSVAPDYIRHTSSLNNHQAAPSADGSFTYVLCPRDPGYRNWIDSVGMHAGLITLRWQELTDKTVSPDHAIRSVKVVKLSQLKGAMPSEVQLLSAFQRRIQLADRARSYALRLD